MDRSGVETMDLKNFALTDALLVTSSSGVVEKLEIARLTNNLSTLGDDLVASCLNTVLGAGATPLFFSYRLAGGGLGEAAVEAVAQGVAQACTNAACKLLVGSSTLSTSSGGADSCELTGFAVAALERSRPDVVPVSEGDVIFGIPSSSVDGSVVTLARRVMEDGGINLADPAPFSLSGKTFGSELLTATTVLPSALKACLTSGKAKALVPLPSASLVDNVERALASHLAVRLDAATWTLPPLLGWLAAQGSSEQDLLTGSNLGLAALVVVAKGNADNVRKVLQADGVASSIVGIVEPIVAGNPRVGVTGLRAALDASWPRPAAATRAQKRRVGVLVTDCGKNLRALIEATRDPRRRTNADIVLVVSNKSNVEALEVAKLAGIPTKTINHREFPTRVDFDMAVHAALTSSDVDLVCLARFVRILSGEFTRLWRGRVINLHPAILPLFKGIHVQKQALDAGVRLTGCSVHFVEEAVDAGAIIIQEPLPIEPQDTVDSLLERMKRLEVRIYPRALSLVATGRVAVGLDGRIVWNF